MSKKDLTETPPDKLFSVRFEAMHLNEWWGRVRHGLHCAEGSGEYEWARGQRRRLWSPVCAICVPLIVVLLIVLLAWQKTDARTTETFTYLPDKIPKQQLDPLPPEPTDDISEADALPDVTMTDISFSDPSPTLVGPTPSLISPLRVALPPATVVRGSITFNALMHTRGDAGRSQGLKRFNAPPGTGEAILRALRWLKLHQHSDGYWDGRSGGSERNESAAALTGLALLTFLAHGEHTGGDEFGQTVEQALRWLIAAQSGGSTFSNRDGHDYAHPICAYAISEAYSMMHLPELKMPAERAIQRIVDGQHPDGGWDYNLKITDRNDLSYSAWCIQALKAARIGKIDVAGLGDALRKAVDGVSYHQARSTGRFGYTGPSTGSGGLTSAGVLCLQLLGAGDSAAVTAGLTQMGAWTCRWDSPQGKSPLYYWYYATQAKFHAGASTWNTWNKQFSREFSQNQIIVKNAIATPDGRRVDVGYWKPCSTSEHGQSFVYNTTLCALTLQVYFRSLPTYMDSAIQDGLAKRSKFDKDPREIPIDSF